MRNTVRPLTEEARQKVTGVKALGSSPFRVGWADTRHLLEYELEKIGGSGEIVLQLDVTEADIRIDNTLRAAARPATPIAAVSVETKGGPLLFVCARFPHWQDNVRAIALGLEALRKVDRYGITQASEQYRGFRALPPGLAIVEKPTVEDAARFLIIHGSTASAPELRLTVAQVMDDPRAVDGLYRVAAKRLHPDIGGDAALFARLTEARNLLTTAAVAS